MIRTKLCDLLGIEVPILLAPMGTGATSAELAAAVSNNGGLGGIGTLWRPFDAVKRDIDEVRRLTNRHYAISHIPRTLDREAFEYTLAAKPAVISFALADPGDLIQEAHAAGALVIVQVTTAAQAAEAVSHGADVIVAQGSEAGGYTGEVSTMTLVPQVVDVAGSVPVVAAGGIYDGRGIAAALTLGAAGVNIGTRFLAAAEAPVEAAYKQAIVEAKSEDTYRAEVMNDIVPLPGTAGYGTMICTLRTPFLEEWGAKRDEARHLGAQLWEEIAARTKAGRRRETLVSIGQTAGGIASIRPVAEIMHELIRETEAALGMAASALV